MHLVPCAFDFARSMQKVTSRQNSNDVDDDKQFDQSKTGRAKKAWAENRTWNLPSSVAWDYFLSFSLLFANVRNN